MLWIWGTYQREPSLPPEREKMFYGVLYNKGKELGLKIHAAGNVEDHVHIVVSIPPKLSVADCVRHIKGASTYAIHHMDGRDGKFKWQEGYGALSVSENTLETVMEYAAKQKKHHCENEVIAVYENIEED